jgi:hypothetical protein
VIETPDIKTEISKKNPYWISKHRYLQLVHYCLQYSEWKDQLNSFTAISAVNMDGMPRGTGTGRSLENTALMMAALSAKIERVESAAREADPVLAPYLIRAVTRTGVGYDYLRQVMRIPCGRRQYYNLRRKFFWILSGKVGD